MPTRSHSAAKPKRQARPTAPRVTHRASPAVESIGTPFVEGGLRLAHDMANALGAIRLRLLGLRMARTDEERREHLDEANRAADETAAGIDRLRAFVESFAPPLTPRTRPAAATARRQATRGRTKRPAGKA